jgi:chromosomal replication initiator protein
MQTNEQGIEAIWAKVCKALKADLGARIYNQWLRPIQLLNQDAQGIVYLALPSAFMSSWVHSHYAERILLNLRQHNSDIKDIRIDVASNLAEYKQSTASSPKAPEHKVVESKSAQKFATNPQFTFETFILSESNGVAANAAKMIANGDNIRFNPLYIQSTTGNGKTHLLHSIINHYQAVNPHSKIHYMSAERFMVDFVNALRTRDVMSFKAHLRSLDVLLIDDIQFIFGKESTQEEFLHTLDALLTAGKQIVITGDRPPHLLDAASEKFGIESRLLSRLTQGLVVDIHAPNYTLRRSVLQARCDEARHVHVPANVIDLVAGKISSNMRELLGAFNRLLAYSSLSGKEINAGFAQEVLADIFRAHKRRVTIAEIQTKVADHYRLKISEMLSPRRTRQIVRPRQVAMYLSKQLTPRSLPEIGRHFCGRDHSTIIYAVRQIEKLRAMDNSLDADIIAITQSLESAAH